ncbi:MAG: hypothetical protein ACLP8S_31645 [Solirubrobacteraceae bacterium]
MLRHHRAAAFWAAVSILLAVPASVAALPRVPTHLGGAQGGLQVRPPVIDFTGDGTGFLGGFTGRSAARRPSRLDLAWAGRLHWTICTDAEGIATGADWQNDGIPDDADGTFYPESVTVRVYRPRSGVFTRMATTEEYDGRIGC